MYISGCVPRTRVNNTNLANFGKMKEITKAIFTLYWVGLCSVSKVAPVQCEQEYVHCYFALQKFLRFQTVHTSPVRSGLHLDPVAVASNLPVCSGAKLLAFPL